MNLLGEYLLKLLKNQCKRCLWIISPLLLLCLRITADLHCPLSVGKKVRNRLTEDLLRQLKMKPNRIGGKFQIIIKLMKNRAIQEFSHQRFSNQTKM
jgi:hypothetical protein